MDSTNCLCPYLNDGERDSTDDQTSECHHTHEPKEASDRDGAHGSKAHQQETNGCGRLLVLVGDPGGGWIDITLHQIGMSHGAQGRLGRLADALRSAFDILNDIHCCCCCFVFCVGLLGQRRRG